MNRLFLLVVFLIAPVAKTQQLPPLQELLGRIYDFSARYTATLPSVSCDESIVSQRVKKGKVKKTVRVEGTMREIRTEDSDDPFREQHDFKTANGKRIKNELELQMPYFVQGAFANMIGFRRRDLSDCFEYHLSWASDGKNVQLDISVKPFPEEPDDGRPRRHISICSEKVWQGSRWRVIADPETGRILHNERTITPENANAHNEAYFAAMDYTSQQFGGRTLWLPSRFYTEDVGDKGRMYANYSNCHRYTGEMRIMPDAEAGYPQIAPAKPQ